MLFLLLFSGLKTNAQAYDIFVDTNNSGAKDGSETNPFNTISDAINLATSNDTDHRKIYVKNGEYLENIALSEGTEIFGEDENDTIINGGVDSATAKMSNNTTIKNLKIYKGHVGILVEKNSKVEISDVKIQKTKKKGIEIEESTKKRVATIKNCTINGNDSKGIYIQKGNYVKITGNEIYDNDEEGIDMRASVMGSIKNNKIHDNGEGGIELIIEKSKIKIDKNKIYKNSASGISLQAYQGGLSSLSNNNIERNKITSNKRYGITCDTPSKLKSNKPVLWSQSTTLKSNVLSKNKLGLFSDICHFPAK